MNYKAEGANIRHIGPVAQDFQAPFGLGGDGKTISTVDPAGIALAAIQELNRRLEQKTAELQGGNGTGCGADRAGRAAAHGRQRAADGEAATDLK